MSDGVYTRQGQCSALNIAAATVVKACTPDQTLARSRVTRVFVNVAGSAAGAVYDSSLLTGNVAANQIAVIPNAVGIYLIDCPLVNGLLIVPGTGQTVAVTYD